MMLPVIKNEYVISVGKTTDSKFKRSLVAGPCTVEHTSNQSMDYC